MDPDHYSQAFQELIVEQHLSKNMGRITISLNKTYNEFNATYCDKCKRNKKDCVYVDCASVLAGVINSEKKNNLITINTINLSDISIAINDAVNRLQNKNSFIIFDSIQTLLIYFSEEDIFRFLHSLILKLKQFGATAFLLSVNQEIGREMTKVLSTVADEYLQYP